MLAIEITRLAEFLAKTHTFTMVRALFIEFSHFFFMVLFNPIMNPFSTEKRHNKFDAPTNDQHKDNQMNHLKLLNFSVEALYHYRHLLSSLA